MVDEAAKSGAIHEHASALASRALDFDRLTLSAVMLPRARIDALPINATMDQIRRFLLEERRSRVPSTIIRWTRSSATSARRTSCRWPGTAGRSC